MKESNGESDGSSTQYTMSSRTTLVMYTLNVIIYVLVGLPLENN